MSGINIPTHFWEEYKGNVHHLLQYEGSKFEGSVTVGSYSSNGAAAVEQYGATEMVEVTGRFAPMARIDRELDRVWVYPKDYDHPELVDPFDLLRLLQDPKSELVKGAVKAAKRKKDDIITSAFYAAVKSGTDGSTSDTFDTTNHRVDAAVGASADTGMNVEKLLDAMKIMENLEIDFDVEEAYVAITPTQENNLLRQQQVINSDYSNLGMLAENGRLKRLGVFNVIVSTKVPSNASYRLCPAWVKSGMHLGVWDDVKIRHDPRPDLQGVPHQIYTTLSMGATRVEAGKVVQIECTE